MQRWNAHYETGNLPWNIGGPEPLLVAAHAAGGLGAGRALEIGCGTGDNARFLASAGFDVTAVDIAPAAIALAQRQGGPVRYAVHDIQSAEPPGGPYDFVFDRGVFHVFGARDARATFARHVAAVLRPGGLWMSLVGSTEGAPRDQGPPRRTARDIAAAVEPVLEIVELRSASFFQPHDEPRAWVLWARKRTMPAQPASD